MRPDRVSNPGPLTYKSGALTTALRGPAAAVVKLPPVLGILNQKHINIFKTHMQGPYQFAILNRIFSQTGLLRNQ